MKSTTIQNLNSLEDKCQEYSELLGIDKPVSIDVLLAAVEDESYANNLLECRKTGQFLDLLLSNPPKIKKISTEQTSNQTNIKAITNAELLLKATKAIARWSKVGFSIVDNEILERRENACLACPNLSDPEKTLQKMIPSKKINEKIGERTGKKVCKLCGCNVGKKMRLSSESCPDKHPAIPGMTRWEEPIQ